MKNPWIAAVLNFFLMGLGTFYVGKRKVLGLGLTIAAILLTCVELQLQAAANPEFPFLFGTVFFMNVFFAYDGYLEAKAANASAQEYSVRA